MADKNIGQRLKEAREQKRLTQKEVIKKLGIPNVQTLSAYESGTNNPPMGTTFKQLLQLYGVSADWILFGDKRQNTAEKAPYDFFLQLVESVDFLGLELTISEGHYGDKWLNIDLSTAKHEETEQFIEKWQRFRKLLDHGDLDRMDYEELLMKRAPKQLHEKQAKNASESEELLPSFEVNTDSGQLPF